MSNNPTFCDSCGAANGESAARCFACGQDLTSFPPIPATLHNGQYQLLEVIGQGGYGTVYKASDTSEKTD